MNKLILGLLATSLIVVACGNSSTPVIAPDPATTGNESNADETPGGESDGGTAGEVPAGTTPVESSSAVYVPSTGTSSASGNASLTPETNIASGYLTDSRDNQRYPVKRIGTQVWMTQNLNYVTEGSYCESESTCKTNGRFYDLSTALTACPAGWHLPTKEEFETLLKNTGALNDGGVLKASSWGGSNKFGFNLVATGFYLESCTLTCNGVGIGTISGESKGVIDKFSTSLWSSTDCSDSYTTRNCVLDVGKTSARISDLQAVPDVADPSTCKGSLTSSWPRTVVAASVRCLMD